MKTITIKLLAVSFVLLLASCSQKQAPFEEKILFQGVTGKVCYRIPSIITAKNGTLIAAADERIAKCDDLRTHEDINIVVRLSSDNGETWSEEKRVVDFPFNESASDPSMILDKETGDIFLFYNYMNLETEKDVYYLHYVKSMDNGLTWSEPVDITSEITKPEWKNHFKFIASGRGCQTKQGVLLHCLVDLQQGVIVFGSSDHGQTWFFVDSPVKPADESKIVELPDGTWLVNSRVQSAGMRYIHTSTDNGLTWVSREEPLLPDPACNAEVILTKDLMIFSNAFSKTKRENLTISVSQDWGQTWGFRKTVCEGDAAYSALTELKNGDIAVLYERDDYTKIVFNKFTLSQLMEK